MKYCGFSLAVFSPTALQLFFNTAFGKLVVALTNGFTRIWREMDQSRRTLP